MKPLIFVHTVLAVFGVCATLYLFSISPPKEISLPEDRSNVALAHALVATQKYNGKLIGVIEDARVALIAMSVSMVITGLSGLILIRKAAIERARNRGQASTDCCPNPADDR